MSTSKILAIFFSLIIIAFITWFLFQNSGNSNKGKIYAAGSGLNMMSMPETVKEIITLSGKNNPHILYLGTPSYDLPKPETTQTQEFIKQGCTVQPLKVSINNNQTPDQLKDLFDNADIILISGGNTLFAYDRWVKTGIDKLITNSGKLVAGGSAGGILSFDGGHSDSMDPASYKNPPGPCLNPAKTKEEMNAWAYIRVPGLGLLPGLFCPHYDIIESNGVRRADVFTGMLQQHLGETGICVDNWAALIIDDDKYTVTSRTGKPGSVDDNGNFNPAPGSHPGAWKITINPHNGKMNRELIPKKGYVSDLFIPARFIVPDGMIDVARAQNPDDGKPPDPNSEV